MLDLNTPAGKRVIEELTKIGRFDSTRGLIVFQVDMGRMRMRCDEVLPRTEENADKPPYALRLQTEIHFDAMSELKKGE